MSDVITPLLALLGAVTTAFTGNQGGVALAFLLIAGLAWKLRSCDRKHEEVLAQNQRLAIACAQLIAVTNSQAGYEVVSSGSLEDLLQGKPAVRYVDRRVAGRRKNDRGAGDAEDGSAGGSGNVPG